MHDASHVGRLHVSIWSRCSALPTIITTNHVRVAARFHRANVSSYLNTILTLATRAHSVSCTAPTSISPSAMVSTHVRLVPSAAVRRACRPWRNGGLAASQPKLATSLDAMLRAELASGFNAL